MKASVEASKYVTTEGLQRQSGGLIEDSSWVLIARKAFCLSGVN